MLKCCVLLGNPNAESSLSDLLQVDMCCVIFYSLCLIIDATDLNCQSVIKFCSTIVPEI